MQLCYQNHSYYAFFSVNYSLSFSILTNFRSRQPCRIHEFHTYPKTFFAPAHFCRPSPEKFMSFPDKFMSFPEESIHAAPISRLMDDLSIFSFFPATVPGSPPQTQGRSQTILFPTIPVLISPSLPRQKRQIPCLK